jgi:multidrug efflux pump subunit AcrA (membrane-fusion protein)
VQIANNRAYVFVTQGDRVRRRPVELGVDQGEWLEITRGLGPGEQVVVAGADGLSEGAQVRAIGDVSPFTGQPEPKPGPGGGETSASAPVRQ